MIGDHKKLQQIDPLRYVDDAYGLPTVQDVLRELEKPGRDPRGLFKTVQFKEGIEKITDLKIGMILEGVVSNVTNFGAFVDVGVHQDGLVHISSMTHKFIRDPHAIVKAGDVVLVKVVEVDSARRRIGLSMKLEEAAELLIKEVVPPKIKKPVMSKPKPTKAPIAPKVQAEQKKKTDMPFNTAMKDALTRLKGELR